MEVDISASASNESVYAPVRSIAEAAHDAVKEFEACLELTTSLGPREQALIQDQLARFSLWSSTIGVFAPDRASMDYRLRDAQDTRDLVQDLLQGLCGTLTKCVSKLASWVQLMRPSEMPDAASIENLSRDVQKIVQRCADDIGLLHRLSNTIRKASRDNQNSRAASSFKILDAEGNNMEDPLHAIFLHHMEDQFPGCDDMLRRRLASAMVLRRRRILYRRSRLIRNTVKVPSHLAEHVVQIIRPPHRSITLVARSEGRVPNDDKSPALHQPLPLQSSVSSRVWTATTVDVDKLEPPTAPSVMSFAKTVPLKREHNLIFPPPPRAPMLAQFRKAKTRLRQDHRLRLASLPNYDLFIHHEGCPPLSDPEFELLQDQIQDARQELKQQLETEKIAAQLSETEVICPYCCWTLSARDMRNETKWQEHVKYDLDPYVCLFEKCEKADELYTHSEPWLRHMKQHALRWTCTAKSHHPVEFDEKKDYEEHMRTTHKGAFTDAQLSAVSERIGRTTGPLFQSCPLCGISDDDPNITESLEDHVVGHLRFLALKALPLIDEEQEDEDTDSFRSAASKSIAQPADRSTILGLEQDTSLEGIDYEAGSLERTSDLVDPIDPFVQWGGYRRYISQFYSGPRQEKFAGARQPSFLPPDDPDASAVNFIDPSDCYGVDHAEARQSQWGYVLATTTAFHNGQKQDPILKKFQRKPSTTRSRNDWAVHYKLKRDDVKDVPKWEIERQNNIHELVDMEEHFLDQLEVLNTVYLSRLMVARPKIIPPQRLDHFVDAVFGHLSPVTRASKDLLAQLKYLQYKEGPWITGVSSTFREWVRRAKVSYLKYAEAFPYAAYLMRVEIERNHEFQQFVEENRAHRRSGRLGWETFLKAPIIHWQQYSLLLKMISGNTSVDNEAEKNNLACAMEEISSVSHEADILVEKGLSKTALLDIANRLVLRPGVPGHALELIGAGRALIFQGELKRLGLRGSSLVDAYVVLFDDYLILAERLLKDPLKWDVSKEPIPVAFLDLSDMGETPVIRRKGLTSSIKPASLSSDRQTSSKSPAPLRSADLLFPFRIHHLGKETFVLYGSSAQDRETWCQKIVEVKTRHFEALNNQDSNVFRLSSMTEYQPARSREPSKHSRLIIRQSPLGNALAGPRQFRVLPQTYRPPVNCATRYHLAITGKDFLIIGNDRGLYHCSETGAWAEASFSPPKVTSVKVHIEVGVALILADRTLFAIRLQDLHASTSYARQRVITYATSVSSFESYCTDGKHLGIVYLKKDVIGSDVRIIIVDPSEQSDTSRSKRLGLFGLLLRNTKKPTKDSRVEYAAIKAAAKSHAVFLSGAALGASTVGVAVATSKGFWETVIGLETVLPLAFLDIHLLDASTRLRTSRALAIFGIDRFTDLFVYDDRAVVMDKLILDPDRHSITATRTIEYSTLEQKPTSAAVYKQYLLLFFSDFVEIRDIQDGKLSQVISGSGIRLLDPGTVCGPDDGLYADRSSVIFSMDHPHNPNNSIVLQLQSELWEGSDAHESRGSTPDSSQTARWSITQDN